MKFPVALRRKELLRRRNRNARSHWVSVCCGARAAYAQRAAVCARSRRGGPGVTKRIDEQIVNVPAIQSQEDEAVRDLLFIPHEQTGEVTTEERIVGVPVSFLRLQEHPMPQVGDFVELVRLTHCRAVWSWLATSSGAGQGSCAEHGRAVG